MIRPVFLRSANNYDGEIVSRETGLVCVLPSLAVQSQRDEADINTIVTRFGLTGKMPENVRVPSYGDFSGVYDFMSAQNTILAAKEAFAKMPAKVRSRFRNDAAEFVDFCSDSSNMEEMVKLGLAVKKVEDVSRGTENRTEVESPTGGADVGIRKGRTGKATGRDRRSAEDDPGTDAGQ